MLNLPSAAASFSLILVAGTAPVAAQVVHGIIADAESQRRLPAAAVTLLHQDSLAVASATTDRNGAFVLRAPQPAPYRIRVELIGYGPMTSEPITVRAGETVDVAVRLSTRAISLPPVVITARRRAPGYLADFERRRDRGAGGFYVTRAEIERRPIATATMLALGAPGVSVIENVGGQNLSEGRITMPAPGTVGGAPGVGRCYANVYIDGVRVLQESIDTHLRPEQIAAVEVYARAAMAPIEYQDEDCGVVLFWTREGSAAEGGRSWNWRRFAAAASFVVVAALLVR